MRFSQNQLTNFQDLSGGQLLSDSLALRSAPFGDHVLYVVDLGAKKQMRGIHARWIVTLMQYVHRKRVTVVNGIRDAGRSEFLFRRKGVLNNSVSVRVTMTLPRPTFIRRVHDHEFPKTLRRSGGGGVFTLPRAELGLALQDATRGTSGFQKRIATNLAF
jgi:hypothetical protein